MKYEFDAEIKRLEGKIQWSVFYFPKSALDCFGIKGNIPVKITVDGHQMVLMTDNTPKTVAFYKSLGFVKADELGCCAFVMNPWNETKVSVP